MAEYQGAGDDTGRVTENDEMHPRGNWQLSRRMQTDASRWSTQAYRW